METRDLVKNYLIYDRPFSAVEIANKIYPEHAGINRDGKPYNFCSAAVMACLRNIQNVKAKPLGTFHVVRAFREVREKELL